MKAKHVLIAVAIGVLYFVLQSEAFQRWNDPTAYWTRQVEVHESDLKADRQAQLMMATELKRRRAMLQYDLQDDAILSSGDAEMAALLHEATVRTFQADVDSIVGAIHFWQRRAVEDDSALAFALNQLPFSYRIKRSREGRHSPSVSPDTTAP